MGKQTMIGKRRGIRKEGGGGRRMTGRRKEDMETGLGKEREKQEEVGEKENEVPGQHLHSTGGR